MSLIFTFPWFIRKKNGVNWRFSVLTWLLLELTVYGIDVIRNDPARPRPELMPSTDRYHGACTMHINGFGWPKAQPGSVVQPILLPYGKRIWTFLSFKKAAKKRFVFGFSPTEYSQSKGPQHGQKLEYGSHFSALRDRRVGPLEKLRTLDVVSGLQRMTLVLLLEKASRPLWRDHLFFCPLRSEYLNRKCGLKK